MGRLSWLNWNLEVLVFCGGRKSGETKQKPSKQGVNHQQTQTTTCTCMCYVFIFSSMFGNEVKHSLQEKLLTMCCELRCIHENDKV